MAMAVSDIMNALKAVQVPPELAVKTPTLNDGGALGGVECPICKNTGRIVRQENGILYAKECECMNIRRAKKRAAESGLNEIMEHYTFSSYKTPNQWYEYAKRTAKEYCGTKTGVWFYTNGVPGSGKTHLCTAICGDLIKRGKNVKYVLWRELAQKLKSVINEPEYDWVMRGIKNADVLYIDDFMKGTVSDADVNRAFEIINARYNMPSKKTIISSERSILDIRRMDEATGTRIYERSKGYLLKTPDTNWRVQ